MKNKISTLVICVLIIVFISSCNKTEDRKENNSNGEYIMNETNLINSNIIDDNYRVFYEIFPGSFSDSNNDGIGDLKGIINRLDYLNDGDPNSGKSLGIGGIWLTPIFKSPSYHKYDTTDYYSVDPKFGDMDDLKTLISECHKRDIKIILDLVINHTGNENEWFKNFVNAHKNNDPTDPYYDFYSYYTEGEEKPKGTFYKVSGTNIYYEGNFSSSMPELNFDNELVKEEVLKIANYYLNMGVDGFRFDAAKYIYFEEEEKSALFWNWFVGQLKNIKPDIFTVGEVWSPDQVIDKYIEQGLNCFDFSSAQAAGSIAYAVKNNDISSYSSYIETKLKHLNSINPEAILMQFIANHDMDRAAGYLKIDDNDAYMAASLYMLSSGTPFIYYGEEIGIKGSRGSANTDANRRLAMLWGDGDQVKDPVGTTYDNKFQTNGTVKEHLSDKYSLYNHYKKLIMIRNANPEIARGTYKAITFEREDIGGFIVEYNGTKICIIHNISNEDITISMSKLTNISFKEMNAFVGNGTATYDNDTLVISGQTSVVLR